MDPGEYSRELEAYLCRKNDGHLIRIAGPSFEMVCGWAEQGIPFKVACRGVDRCFERYYAKGPRRRPVRIDFCEADVLDAFDEWRRAVGVSMAGGERPSGRDAAKTSLPAHLQRVLMKLTTLRAESGEGAMSAAFDRAIDAVEQVRADGGSLRGDARARAVERLESIDRDLLSAIRGATSPDEIAALRREAEAELAGYAGRMPAGAFAQAVEAATDRLIRERAGLPRITYGG